MRPRRTTDRSLVKKENREQGIENGVSLLFFLVCDSLVPRPSLTAFFAAVAKSVVKAWK